MDYNTLLSKRLKIVLDELFDGNYSAMSRFLGLSDNGLASYIRGTKQKDGSFRLSTPSAEVIANIVDKLEINIEWLVMGKGEMIKHMNHVNEVNEPRSEYNVSKEQLIGIIDSQQRESESKQRESESKQRIIELQNKRIETLLKGGNGTAVDATTARVKKGS